MGSASTARFSNNSPVQPACGPNMQQAHLNWLVHLLHARYQLRCSGSSSSTRKTCRREGRGCSDSGHQQSSTRDCPSGGM